MAEVKRRVLRIGSHSAQKLEHFVQFRSAQLADDACSTVGTDMLEDRKTSARVFLKAFNG